MLHGFVFGVDILRHCEWIFGMDVEREEKLIL
jgi:hypothetical protein